jgi:hypothetical protein
VRYVQDTRCNGVLGAPHGVLIDECGALPVRHAILEDGTAVVQSFWQPTREELDALQAGAPIILTLWGTTHAPVSVGVA